MHATLDDLQTQYERLLQRLLPRVPVSPFHRCVQTRPTHNGDAHVEVVDGGRHYVITERGSELHRRVASDHDELLHWLLDDVTAAISWRSRVPFLHRLLRRDTRRHRFDLHVHLLEKVNPAWAARKGTHYAEVLSRYPYRA